jgi:hypothetical protein
MIWLGLYRAGAGAAVVGPRFSVHEWSGTSCFARIGIYSAACARQAGETPSAELYDSGLALSGTGPFRDTGQARPPCTLFPTLSDMLHCAGCTR